MASDNETVADIVREMRDCVENNGNGNDVMDNLLRYFADSIEAAHKRELEAKEADALNCGAIIALKAQKPKRNCDRFVNNSDAVAAYLKENFHKGKCIDKTGRTVTYLHSPKSYDVGKYQDWLFAPCEEGGTK